MIFECGAFGARCVALTLAVTMMQEIAKLKATPHNGVGVSASCVDDIVDPHTLVINR